MRRRRQAKRALRPTSAVRTRECDRVMKSTIEFFIIVNEQHTEVAISSL